MIAPETDYGWNQHMKIPLLDKLKADLKTALRGKDETAKNAIRLVMGEFPSLTVPLTLSDGKKSFRVKTAEEISDDDILGILRKLVKAERTVLSARGVQTSEYLQFYEAYLPRTATPEEIRAWIQENIDFSRYKSPMQAMGEIMKHYGQRADGRQVKAVLQEFNRT